MRSYVAYGLRIHSEIELPAREAEEAAADVSIRRGSVDRVGMTSKTPGTSFGCADQEVRIGIDGVCTLSLLCGREIIVDTEQGSNDEDVAAIVQGPAIGILLQQRGLAVFHASAVSVDGKGAVFAAPKGHGKSTLAAALHSRGHTFITDDIAAIRMHEMDHEAPTIMPGYPGFRLLEDSSQALGMSSQVSPPQDPESGRKRRSTVVSGFAEGETELHAIYVLTKGARPDIRQLGGEEGFRRLFPHWYSAMGGPRLMRSLGLMDPFVKCMRLGKDRRIHQVIIPNSLKQLDAIALRIESHILEADGTRR